MVNSGDFQGRSSHNVVSLRAVSPTSRGEEPRQYQEHFQPTFVIQSSRGPHAHWRRREGEALEQFTPAQAQLAAYFKTDPKVKDLPRVMRLAGSLHQKDPGNPFLVYVKEAHPERLYRIGELIAAHPAPPSEKKATSTKAKAKETTKPRVESSAARASGTSRIEQAKQSSKRFAGEDVRGSVSLAADEKG
jgi:hypothetical protein